MQKGYTPLKMTCERRITQGRAKRSTKANNEFKYFIYDILCNPVYFFGKYFYAISLLKGFRVCLFIFNGTIALSKVIKLNNS